MVTVTLVTVTMVIDHRYYGNDDSYLQAENVQEEASQLHTPPSLVSLGSVHSTPERETDLKEQVSPNVQVTSHYLVTCQTK